MSYEALALLLMVIGFALIVAEVFIPSGGMISILCLVTFVASIWSAYKAWYGVANLYFGAFLGTLIILIPTFVIGAFRILERSALGRRVLLPVPTQAEVVPYQDEVQRLAALKGRLGQALTLMTPGGIVLLDGERLHAVSEGTAITAGQPVEVIGVRGTRVVVREAASVWIDEGTADRPTSPSATTPLGGAPEEPPLDFDFPQG